MLRLILFLLPIYASAQSYTSFFTGDTTDVSTAPSYGLVLAGGGGDNDEAMQWMLQRADEGDVVVIRASGSDGYNPYFFSELGVSVNSVETIRFENGQAATDDYVVQQIRNAECLFIAGGDQYDYYRYWKDSPVEDAINYLLREKGVPVGGTSAGMAILGDWYYTPEGSSLSTEEALSDPYHPDYEILAQDSFLQPPFMMQTITDTHYEQRERPGRHMGFLARIAQATGERSFGIAANEYTAVCIDENGIARAFGDYPEYEEDAVFFLQANCQDEFLPEAIAPNTPLTWNRGNSAVKVYAVPARPDGSGQFNLNDWQTGDGGEWQNWYVQQGELNRVAETDGDCGSILTSTSDLPKHTPQLVFPNPAQDYIYISGRPTVRRLQISNLQGQILGLWETPPTRVFVGGLPSGVYLLEMISQEGRQIIKLQKQ